MTIIVPRKNKLFLTPLFILLATYIFIGCDNGGTNGALNPDDGKTIFSVPYTTKEQYTVYGQSYTHYLVSTSFREAESIIDSWNLSFICKYRHVSVDFEFSPEYNDTTLASNDDLVIIQTRRDSVGDFEVRLFEKKDGIVISSQCWAIFIGTNLY